MVVCACGKKMDRVPSWLASVNVEFVCTNCPRRQIRSITQLSAEEIVAPVHVVKGDLMSEMDTLEDAEA